MKISKILDAQKEAKRFLEKVKKLQATQKWSEQGKCDYLIFGSKESAALKRASLDLTRALAEMRKP